MLMLEQWLVACVGFVCLLIELRWMDESVGEESSRVLLLLLSAWSGGQGKARQGKAQQRTAADSDPPRLDSRNANSHAATNKR